MGVSFSEDKIERIISGDLSSQAIHPALVYLSHMWGSVFWQKVDSICLDDEIGFFKLALESLEGNSCRPPEPIEAIQARYLLSIYCFIRGDLDRALQLHTGAGKVVADHQLHISHPDLSTDSRSNRERLQALCYLLFLSYNPLLPFKMEPELSAQMVQELEAIIVSGRMEVWDH